MASLFIKNGTYYVSYKDKKGKWQNMSTHTADPHEAENILSIYNQSKVLEQKDGITLEDMKEKVLQWLECNKVQNKKIDIPYSKKTIWHYAWHLKWFIDFAGNVNINSISWKIIEDYISEIEKNGFPSENKDKIRKGCGSASINVTIRTLKAMFNIAIKRLKLLNQNPLTVPDHEIKFRYDKQVDELMTNKCFQEKEIYDLFDIMDCKTRMAAQLCFYAGLRLGEMTNLEWEDINLSRKMISIRNKKEIWKNGVVIRHFFRTKSGKDRTLKLSDKLKSLLMNYKYKKDNGYIICYDTEYCKNKRYETNFISKKFKDYCVSAGLPENLHLHSLRHTFCSSLSEQGVPLTTIQKMAGHASLKTTELYLHTSEESMSNAVNLL